MLAISRQYLTHILSIYYSFINILQFGKNIKSGPPLPLFQNSTHFGLWTFLFSFLVLIPFPFNTFKLSLVYQSKAGEKKEPLIRALYTHLIEEGRGESGKQNSVLKFNKQVQ